MWFKKSIRVGVFLLTLITIFTSCGNELKTTDTAIYDIANDLIMITYNNDYNNIIDNLPSIVTDEAKLRLEEFVSSQYADNSTNGSIKQSEVIILDSDYVKEKTSRTVVFLYNELSIYSVTMTCVVQFKVSNDKIVNIDIKTYTNSRILNLN